MTRDDILKILALKSEDGKMMKSARRMMRNSIPKRDDDGRIHDVVDKLIAEVPRDDHKLTANESIYWDPQGALEDLKEYYDAKRDGRRLFKGERTSVRDWPFMVSIHIMGKFWCGGALYWNDLVITSASCLQLLYNNRFYRENPRVVQVRIGSNHSRVGGELIDVLEVYFHPAYDPKSLQNNLAVTRLRRHLAFSYHRIPKIISISDLPTTVPSTAEVLILGWGVTKLSQKLSYEPIFLQKKYLPVYPNTFCKEVYGKNFITEKMFCAGTITTGEGACDHDAGGPAIFAGRLVGIISFGPSVCGFTNAPTVFTLIGAFSDWIETVNESMPNYYRAKRPTTSSTKSIIDGYFATWQDSKLKNAEKIRAETKMEPLGIPTEHTPEIPLSETFENETPAPIETTEPTDTPTDTTEPNENIESPEVTEPTTPEMATTETSPMPPGALRMEDSDGGWSIENRK
ncbi:unnamed protein product [Arctia plantaginis]|uniref:Peptidase S1 domain-containing protein n=1 Tax=Arctia plantaginis TaxID=874455 RepID=A0A8S1AXY7_ARCPL|nr:unnamed protein product [Arctia plantaginis]